MTTAVIIVAAGSGTRLGSPLPKAFVSVAGVPMLQHSLTELSQWTRWDSLVLVVPEGYEAPARALATGMESVHVVVGGETRGDSVQQGLSALPPETTHVLIHDAARALMPCDVFDRVLDALGAGASGVIPHVPVVDTLVRVESSLTEGGVDRDELGAVQTPQGFDVEALRRAYADTTEEFTDDAAVLRRAGHDVVGVEGHPRGFKITTRMTLSGLNPCWALPQLRWSQSRWMFISLIPQSLSTSRDWSGQENQASPATAMVTPSCTRSWMRSCRLLVWATLAHTLAVHGQNLPVPTVECSSITRWSYSRTTAFRSAQWPSKSLPRRPKLGQGATKQKRHCRLWSVRLCQYPRQRRTVWASPDVVKVSSPSPRLFSDAFSGSGGPRIASLA
jgi:2-C-methyl-D-erythritol 4-phosphate cytidylyltransferase